MRFYSKHDIWLGIILIGIVGFSTVMTIIESGFTQTSTVTIAVFVFVIWVWFGTYYEVIGNKLTIFFGPFRKSVDIAKIIEIHDTHNPLTAPACSLDRMMVRGHGTRLIISPKDKAGFVQALKSVNPNIVYNPRINK